MKKPIPAIVPALLFSLLPLISMADCRNDAIVYQRSTSFGLSLSGNGGSLSGNKQFLMNLPVRVGDNWGCYKLKSKLSVKSESVQVDNQGHLQGEILITPATADFEGIPGSRVLTYLIASKEEQVRFSLLSFTCAGEEVLGFEATSGNLADLKDLESSQLQIQNVFASGIAAKNLRLINASGFNRPQAYALRDFLPLVADLEVSEKGGGDSNSLVVPEVFAQLNMQVEQNRFSQTYESIYKGSLNACKSKVSERLSAFELQNFQHNPSLQDFQVKKTWKNQLSVRFE